jgi:WS/DGAT/MGAT family acyltransferase
MAATPARERISAVDTAWLRMDRPHNLMMICGVLMLHGELHVDRLRAVVAERLLSFRRFRQRPVERDGVTYWEDDPRFDLARHVLPASLPADADRAALQRLASTLIATPLPPRHPLWQLHVVRQRDGGSAIVMRIHHCYADGIALVRVMLSMTDAAPDGPPAMPFEPKPPDVKPTPKRKTEAATPPFDALMRAVRAIGSTLIDQGALIFQEPAKALDLAGHGTAFASEIAKLALMGQDSRTRFKGTPGRHKGVAWSEPLPLSDVKAVGHALRASVNDVLLSCVAGALRRYLVGKGDSVEGVTFRALIPVNLRPVEDAYKLGNQFGLVFCELPIAIANPVERLYAVRANMAALRGSYQPVLALGILAAMGAGPRILQETLLSVLARNATAVMTNVPGPQQPLYLAGCRIDSLMFWVPQSGDIGIGVSILSFDGHVRFGLVADANLCPDPEAVIAGFAVEFEKLVLTTLMAPWPREGDLDPGLAAQAVGANA